MCILNIFKYVYQKFFLEVTYKIYFARKTEKCLYKHLNIKINVIFTRAYLCDKYFNFIVSAQ